LPGAGEFGKPLFIYKWIENFAHRSLRQRPSALDARKDLLRWSHRNDEAILRQGVWMDFDDETHEFFSRKGSLS
jgi:hypothetical protein